MNNTPQRTALGLLTSGPATVGLAYVPDLLAVVHDFAAIVAWATIVFYLMITSGDLAGVLRERAEMVSRRMGAGRCTNRPASHVPCSGRPRSCPDVGILPWGTYRPRPLSQRWSVVRVGSVVRCRPTRS